MDPDRNWTLPHSLGSGYSNCPPNETQSQEHTAVPQIIDSAEIYLILDWGFLCSDFCPSMTVAYHEIQDSWRAGDWSYSMWHNRTRIHKMEPTDSSVNWLRHHHSLVRKGTISIQSSFREKIPSAPPTGQSHLSPGIFQVFQTST